MGVTGTVAALGADGTVVKVHQTYIDWVVPQTDFSLCMGIQLFNLPRKGGGGLVMDNADVAGIVGSYRLSDSASLTGFWVRPFNDNYTGYENEDGRVINKNNPNYLDPAAIHRHYQSFCGI